MKLFRSLVFAVTIAATFRNEADAYKILSIFPNYARSHWIVGNALMKGLADAGHEVTIISPFLEKNPPKNYRQIELDELIKETFQGKKLTWPMYLNLLIIMSITLLFYAPLRLKRKSTFYI